MRDKQRKPPTEEQIREMHRLHPDAKLHPINAASRARILGERRWPTVDEYAAACALDRFGGLGTGTPTGIVTG